MSLEDFTAAKKLEKASFNSLIFAAIHNASTEDLRKLHSAFPELFREHVARQNSKDGKLHSEA